MTRSRRAALRGSPGTLLGVWAHPDDEVFLSGGIMGAAARQGFRVVCLHLSRGELGSQDEARWPRARLAAIRSAELERSLAILGVREALSFDYPDGGLSKVAPQPAMARITAVMEDVNPDVVLTFGPDGFTGHPDHRAASRLTTIAFSRYARTRRASLYYTAVTPSWKARFVPALNEFNAFWPGYPLVTQPEHLSVEYRLDPELLELKTAALEAHSSQMNRLFEAFGRGFCRALGEREWFRDAGVSRLEAGAATGAQRSFPAAARVEEPNARRRALLES